jgi:hypothetical protein
MTSLSIEEQIKKLIERRYTHTDSYVLGEIQNISGTQVIKRSFFPFWQTDELDAMVRSHQLTRFLERITKQGAFMYGQVPLVIYNISVSHLVAFDPADEEKKLWRIEIYSAFIAPVPIFSPSSPSLKVKMSGSGREGLKSSSMEY